MDISQKCKGYFNLITVIVVVVTITVTWNLTTTNIYLWKSSNDKPRPQILNTSNINYIDPSNCFISDMNQSVEGIIYSAKQHGALMNTLMEQYIVTNKLKIFTMHYMRYPTLYEYKCKIPMTSLHISESNYFIDSQFYHRNHNRNNVLVPDFCLYYDVYFLYNYIYKTYFNTTSKWALILEDDITLCPSIINALLNVMNDTYIYEIHNYPMNKTIDSIHLGHGATGTLLRISFIPKIIQQVLNGYIEKQTRLIKQNNWHSSIDWYIVRWGKKIFGDYSFVGNRYNLLFHPPNHISNSTMGNSYPSSLKCDGINSWRSLGLKLRDLTK